MVQDGGKSGFSQDHREDEGDTQDEDDGGLGVH
jgi:hypothetical protein